MSRTSTVINIRVPFTSLEILSLLFHDSSVSSLKIKLLNRVEMMLWKANSLNG